MPCVQAEVEAVIMPSPFRAAKDRIHWALEDGGGGREYFAGKSDMNSSYELVFPVPGAGHCRLHSSPAGNLLGPSMDI